MKRPFAVIGFTAFAVLLMLSLTESNAAAYCVLFLTALSGILSLFKRNLRQALSVPVCLFTAVAACLFFLSFNTQRQSAQSLTGNSLTVKATVAEAPYINIENGRHYCVLELISVSGRAASGRLRLSFSPEEDGIDADALEIGNGISFKATVYIPGEDEKSVSRYFAGENIVLGAYNAEYIIITQATERSISYYFHKLRTLVTQRLRYSFGDKVAGVLAGIMTGDKSCLDPQLYEAFRQTGIAHLMAVSGLHLSLWVFTLSALIPVKRKSEKLRTVLIMSAVVFIMLLSGMSESVKRAGFMCLAYLSGRLISRNSDSLNSLGLAVMLMLICSPSSVLSVSLQLSFLSTLGILTLGKRCLEASAEIFGGKSINTPLRKLLRYISDMFFISISVLIFTLPVLIFNFGGISTVSAWVNMLISPVVTPLLITAGLCALLSGVPFLLCPLSVFVRLSASYIIFVAQGFTGSENAFITAEPENLPFFIAAAVIITVILVILLGGPFRRRTALTVLSLAAASALIIYGNTISDNALKLHLRNYGDTYAVALQKGKTALLLYDTDKYERSLFISELTEKGAADLYELIFPGPPVVMSLEDGKFLTDLRGFSFSIKETEDGAVKYIYIFSGGALQNGAGYDIIVKLTESDIILSVGGKEFSPEKGDSLTLTVTENNTVVRGEGLWLNLTKSS